MSTQDANKEVVRRLLEEVVNTGDVSSLPELVHPDCVEVDGQTRVISGVEGLAEHVRIVRAMYEGLHVTILNQIAEGDWVATVLVAEGVHSGEWLGMAPTGKRLSFSGVNVDRVIDGKIVEHGGAANMLQPFIESGAIKPVRP